jgi:hypothetical protein
VSRRAGMSVAAALLAALALALASPSGAAGLTLTVKTVPALEGLDFTLGGHTYTTPKSGVVAIPIAAPGTYSLVAPRQHHARGIRAAFSRWGDDSFDTNRTVTVDRSRTLEVGYGVSFLRGLSFFDCVRADKPLMRTGCEDNYTRPVPQKRVTTVSLASSVGETFPFRSNQRRWLEGVRVARRLTSLEETPITYSVMRVIVGGSDVVNQAQQRFYLSRDVRPQGRLSLADKTLRIRLSLYDAHFSTHDLLLRGPIGQVLQLTYPDGRKRDEPLHHGEASLHSMPRGLYQVKVKTGAGIPMEVPVSHSKNQDVQLKVISYADVGGSFLVFALVSIVLVMARRPTLRSTIRRRITRLGRNWRRAMEVGR